MQERNALSREVYGLDNQIIDRLLLLGWRGERWEKFMSLYEQKFGAKAAGYAREAWLPWSKKERGISGQSAQHFIELAPHFLSWDEKYKIVSLLYEKTRRTESHYLEAVLGVNDGAFRDLENLMGRLSLKPLEHDWPEGVKKFVRWICEEDLGAAKQLIAAIDSEQSLLIVTAARVEVKRLVTAVIALDSNVSGTHTVTMPYGTISIHIRKPTMFEKLKKMFA